MLSDRVTKHIFATVKNYGRNIDGDVLDIWEVDLSPYSDDQIVDALARYRSNRANDRAPTIGQIIALIAGISESDGRPSPDEAWGIIKPLLGDEQQSGIVTLDMEEPWNLAYGVWPDEVGARMTFIAAYKRAVEDARQSGVKVKWRMALGYSKDHATETARRGLNDGRLTREQVAALLPMPTQHGIQAGDLLRENIHRTDSGLPKLQAPEQLENKQASKKIDEMFFESLKKIITIPEKESRKEPNFRPIRQEDIDKFPKSIEGFKQQYRAPQPRGTLSIGMDGAPQRWERISGIENHAA